MRGSDRGPFAYVVTLDPRTALTGRAHFMKYVFEGIRAAGLPTDYSIDYVGDPNAINIIVDGFSLLEARDMMATRVSGGGQHIIVAPEFLTQDTFNRIGEQTGTLYDDDEGWRAQFAAFSLVAERAQAIWVATPYQVEAYRHYFPNTPVLPIPLLFAPGWHHRPVSAPRKRRDIAFMGTPTTRRKPMLDALSAEFDVYCPPLVDVGLFGHIVSQNWIGLHLGLKEGWPYTSSMRHLSLLHCDTYVLSEQSELPGELDSVIEVVARNALVDTVRERLADKAALAQAIRDQRQRFTRLGSIKNAFTRLLRDSFATQR